MATHVSMKVALVALLVGAVVIGNGPPPYLVNGLANSLLLGLFAIGVFNALVSTPGTLWVRYFGIACSFMGLTFPGTPRDVAVLALWLVWPLAYLIMCWLEAERAEALETQTGGPLTPARGAVAAIITAVAVATLTYEALFARQLQQTAALFIGIPSVLAIIVVLFVSPRSATGVACKAVTVGLLVSMVFLGEGMVCVLMSAPLFYGIALAIGEATDAAQRLDERNRTLYSSIFLIVFLPMSLEGVTPSMSFSRNETVTATRIVHASAQEIHSAVLEPPRFDRAMPLPLRIGFPRPTSARIEDGSQRWIIRMRGGEMRLDGMEPRAGDLILELDEARPGLVRWRAISDDSHMTHFLSWQSATVEWTSIDAQTTHVTWTLRYRRGLDPAWYFGPWERYLATMAAAYLIDAVATP